MTPPRYVRERTDFRLSAMLQLHSHFAVENTAWRRSNNQSRRASLH
jgi:hypothetical protein